MSTPSLAARQAATKRYSDDWDYIASEARWLLDGATPPHETARRLGLTVAALEKRARRRGDEELARVFLQAKREVTR